MLSVKAGGRTVSVGDTVYYRKGAETVLAEVLDVTNAAENTLALRVKGRIFKGVPYSKTRFGSWRVEKR